MQLGIGFTSGFGGSTGFVVEQLQHSIGNRQIIAITLSFFIFFIFLLFGDFLAKFENCLVGFFIRFVVGVNLTVETVGLRFV